MITKDKIKIFKKYGGDADSWVRVGTKNENVIMTGADWFLIEKLIQNLIILSGKLGSPSFNEQLNSELEKNCDDRATIELLKSSITDGY